LVVVYVFVTEPSGVYVCAGTTMFVPSAVLACDALSYDTAIVACVPVNVWLCDAYVILPDIDTVVVVYAFVTVPAGVYSCLGIVILSVEAALVALLDFM